MYDIFKSDMQYTNQYITTKYSIDRKILSFYIKFARKKYKMLKDLLLSDPSTSFLLMSVYNFNGFNPFYNESLSDKRNIENLNRIVNENFNYYFKLEPSLRMSDMISKDVKDNITNLSITTIQQNKELSDFFLEKYKEVFVKVYNINNTIFEEMNDFIANRYLRPFADDDVEDLVIYQLYYANNITNYKILSPILLSDLDLYNDQMLDILISFNDNLLENPVYTAAYAHFIALLLGCKNLLNPTTPMKLKELYHLPETAGRFIYSNIDSNIKFLSAKINNEPKLFTLYSYNGVNNLKKIDQCNPYTAIDVLSTCNKCNKIIDTITPEYISSLFTNIPGVTSVNNVNITGYGPMHYAYNILYTYLMFVLQYNIIQFNQKHDIKQLSGAKYRYTLFYIESLILTHISLSDYIDSHYKPFIDENGYINIICQFELDYLSKMKPQSAFCDIDLMAHSQDSIVCRLTSNPDYNLEDSIDIVEKRIKSFSYYSNLHIKSVQDFSVAPDIKSLLISPFYKLIPHLNNVLAREQDIIRNICGDIIQKYNAFDNKFQKIYYNGNIKDFMVELKYYYEKFMDEDILSFPLMEFKTKNYKKERTTKSELR